MPAVASASSTLPAGSSGRPRASASRSSLSILRSASWRACARAASSTSGAGTVPASVASSSSAPVELLVEQGRQHRKLRQAQGERTVQAVVRQGQAKVAAERRRSPFERQIGDLQVARRLDRRGDRQVDRRAQQLRSTGRQTGQAIERALQLRIDPPGLLGSHHVGMEAQARRRPAGRRVLPAAPAKRP